jgi:hypothetical protein
MEVLTMARERLFPATLRVLASRRTLLKELGAAAFTLQAGTVLMGGEISPGAAIGVGATPDLDPFLGNWRYRSFRNVVGPVTKLDELLFWEATLAITPDGPIRIVGDIGDGSDKLTLRGSVTFGFPNFLRFEATGIEGTGTAGWKYNYAGFFVPNWPDGVDQRDAIVGSVIRTVPHSNGKAKAGYVASFVAVRL